jgi:REP element-mobilizing transposase RayT
MPQKDPSATINGAVQPHWGEVHIRHRGRLPHWEKEEGLYFLTMHLADSLPKFVLDKIAERHSILQAAQREGARLLPDQQVFVAEYSIRRIEEYFDRRAGGCALGDPRIASSLAEAFRYWHGRRYRLIAWCIMPNHAHVIVRLLPGSELGQVVKSWKLHTALTANRALGRQGRVWQREYFDRLIRDGDELQRAIHYVMQNPAKAGLKDWQWVWSAGLETRTTAALESGATGEGARQNLD